MGRKRLIRMAYISLSFFEYTRNDSSEAQLITMKPLHFLLLLLASPAFATPEIVIEYRDKPPYHYTENGQPKGFLLDRVQQVFRKAGFHPVFNEVPPKRIFQDIQANDKTVCSPGWYKLPERELFARFSRPIHQDKPHLVLTAAIQTVGRHPSLKSLMADQSLTLGVADGVSYGPELDAAFLGMAVPPIKATVSPLQLAKMVAAHRVDYMLIDQEDFTQIGQKAEFSELNLTPIKFPDMPPGLKRYLICSKNVDDRTMAKLDKAISQIIPDLTP